MAWIGRGLAGLGLVLVALCAVILVRTVTYGGPVETRSIALATPSDMPAERGAQRLAEAMRFRTITVAPGDPRAGQDGPWRDMQRWMQRTYPAFHRIATRETIAGLTLIYTWPGSDETLKPLVLMAHQDVVPVNIGTEDDWTAPPFEGQVIEGYVYGRGAIDDKGSMVALFEALETLALDGFKPRRSLILVLGHDEEVSGSGAEAAMAHLMAQGIEAEMALDEGFMVVDPSPLTGKAMGFIGVAEKGYLTLRLTAIAEGGHSSTPPRDSAAVRLSRALVALDQNQMPADFSRSPVRELFQAAAPEMPFMSRMALANMWLFGGLVEGQLADLPAGNAMIRTTTAPTMLTGSAKENVLAQRAIAFVNFRIHPNDSEQDIIDHVRHVTRGIEGLEIDIATTGARGAGASPVSAIDNRAYAVLAAVAREAGGGAPVAPGLVLGATDGRYAHAITDNVYRFAPAVLSPEDLTGFHGTNERISVENMGRLARGYAQIILAMDAP